MSPPLIMGVLALTGVVVKGVLGAAAWVTVRRHRPPKAGPTSIFDPVDEDL